MTHSRIAALAMAALALLGSAASPAAGSTGEGFRIVRFEGRITDASRAGLAATGVRILDYEPDDAYMVWASASQAGAASALDDVRSVERLASDRKIQPELRSATGMVLLDVTAYGPALGGVRRSVGGLGRVGSVRSLRADGLLVAVGLPVPAAAIGRIAALPGVMYVGRGSPGLFTEDEMGDQIVAGNIGAENRAVTGYLGWLAERDLDGEGVTVAVVDTGVEDQHPDLLFRVDKPKDYFFPGEPIDTQGHGTHVAGIIGGAPPAGILPRDPDGFVYGQGMAPKVRIVDLNAIGVAGTTGQFRARDNFPVITKDAWTAGARMWNASWHTGEGSRVGYTATTRTIDVLSRNAVLDAPGSEELLMVFSAGNTGGLGPTVPHEAKNIIAVGATNSGRGLAYPLTGNIDTVAGFSSKGPAKDGRIFPTVSAPGENVVSARAFVGAITATCVPPADGAGLYTTCSGTSMAAPHVAGASALVHQWWKRSHGDAPSPAMVKAQMVNTAKDMGSKNIPNSNEGWGRVNLGALFTEPTGIAIDQELVFGEPAEASEYLVSTAGGTPLKVTLAWSDSPAAVGATKALVNDLDLTVQRLGAAGEVLTTWRGNVFTLGASRTGGSSDRKNNVENVFLNAPAAGTYRIRIVAVNVPGDGIPENEDATDQDFALVVRGATPTT